MLEKYVLCSMSKEYPERAEDLTWRHTVVQYTLLPFTILGVLLIIATLPLFYFSIISFTRGMMIQYIVFGILSMYITAFGEYVIPNGVYTDIRDGRLE